jgi:hypothetical protein
MNHLRKKAAVTKHFSEPYQSLEEMKAGIKADEAAYTDEEVGEIIEGMKQRAGELSGSQGEGDGGKPGATTMALPDIPPVVSAEDMADFKAWQAQQKSLKPASTTELAEAVTRAVPKPTRYKDFDVFQGKVIKETVANPFNPERPNVVINHIQLGERKRLARIEPALAHEFNEYGCGQETGMNHGDVSTAEFYFLIGKYTTGARIPVTEFAEFQRQDIRYADKYHPRKNISLLVAAGYGMPIV